LKSGNNYYSSLLASSEKIDCNHFLLKKASQKFNETQEKPPLIILDV
jgi:hypothetical protein